MRRLITILAGLVSGLLLVLALVGAAYQAIAQSRDRNRHPPMGQLVEVGGVRLHLHCVGTGDPTVVLEAGLGGSHLDWTLVQDSIGAFTRVCAYDRPGLGWSGAVSGPLRADSVAALLHGLLTNAGVNGPYVLVGQSIGGVYVRSFAARYPDDVVGMVLVESAHEEQGNRMPETAGSDAGLSRLLAVCRVTAPLGLMRLLNIAEGFTSGLPFPEAKRRAVVAVMNRTRYCRSLANEIAAADRDTRQPRVVTSLGERPLVVLTAAQSIEDDSAATELERRAADVWRSLQLELTALSSNAQQIVVEDSGHQMQWDRPAAVVDAVRLVVRQAIETFGL